MKDDRTSDSQGRAGLHLIPRLISGVNAFTPPIVLIIQGCVIIVKPGGGWEPVYLFIYLFIKLAVGCADR